MTDEEKSLASQGEAEGKSPQTNSKVSRSGTQEGGTIESPTPGAKTATPLAALTAVFERHSETLAL
jgi:hypothetical protein